MKKIIKLLYRMYPKFFYECIATDFLGEIPKQINDNALGVFEERREKMMKWFLWQSYIIQRKAVSDLKKADFYLGMLTNIKMYITLIGDDETKSINRTPIVKDIKKDTNNSVALFDKVDKFRKGLKNE